QKILQIGGRAADDLRKKLLFSSKNRSILNENSISKSTFSLSSLGKDLEQATSEKDKLLKYQENNVARTKVYDDQSDYYSLENCQWLSKEEREFLRVQNEKMDEQKRWQNSRLNRKIIIDLCGGDTENNENEAGSFENLVQQMKENPNISTQSNMTHKSQAPTPVYQYHLHHKQQNIGPKNVVIQNTVTRLQDLGYKEVQDAGLCLSMHQPYASLLVRGIKKVEGRSWYINHRGILWIASTAKQPDKVTIQEVESNLPAPFPDNYSTGCLVGCVTVTDCLSQEQYRSLYPDGESESPFVAICQDPRELRLKFPISGQHKIYKLDPLLHTAVKKGIEW
uniref:ASCH domain-containing protein n=1 Tax=Romanomermis culicivorax TaxID=13658 RepID=A0A915HFL9_ROMCU